MTTISTVSAKSILAKFGDPIEAVRQAERELLRRKARNSLIDFTQYTLPKYRPAQMHRVIARALEAVLFGQMRRKKEGPSAPALDRLMVLTAPRHGKSELCSRRFPPFCLGHIPDLEFISTSAGSDLAAIFGGEVRDIIKSEDYVDVFPETALKADEQAKGRWKTQQGGSYSTFGVGGKPIGFGANILMIDDPFGSIEDAYSEAVRSSVHDWYAGTMYHRLQPGGAIVLINHRMHDADLAGHLLDLEQHDGDQWHVLCLPAELDEATARYLEREPGEALWEEAYPLPSLARIKKTLGSRYYSSLYLQDPAKAEDGIFKRKWFRKWPAKEPLPVFDFVIQSYDTAFTDQTANDPSAMVVLGLFTDHRGQKGVLIVDAWEEWLDYPAMRARIKRDWESTSYGQAFSVETTKHSIIHAVQNPLIGKGSKRGDGRQADIVLIEEKGSGIPVIQELRRSGGVPVRTFNPGKRSKASRAHAVAPYVEAKRVWAVESTRDADEFVDWVEPLIQQLCQFKVEGSIPHDDLFDAFVQAMLYLTSGSFVSVEDESREADFDTVHPIAEVDKGGPYG